MPFPYSELSGIWKCAIDFFEEIKESVIPYGIATLHALFPHHSLIWNPI